MIKRFYKIYTILGILTIPLIIIMTILLAIIIANLNQYNQSISDLRTKAIPQIVLNNKNITNAEILHNTLHNITNTNDINQAYKYLIEAQGVLYELSFSQNSKAEQISNEFFNEINKLYKIKQEVNSNQEHIMSYIINLNSLYDVLIYDTDKNKLFVKPLENEIIETLQHNNADKTAEILASVKKYYQEIEAICATNQKDVCNLANDYYNNLIESINEYDKSLKELDNIATELHNKHTELASYFSQQELLILSDQLDTTNAFIDKIKNISYVFYLILLLSVFCNIVILKKLILDPIAKIAKVIENFNHNKKIEKLKSTRISDIAVIKQLVNSLMINYHNHIDKMQELSQRYNILLNDIDTDPLTKVFNRRALNKIIETNQKPEVNIAVLMCDIDFFKLVNDSMGHATGDYVLSIVAKTLQEHISKHDEIYRYGGEEFCIILQDIQGQNLADICKRLNKTIENLGIKNEGVQKNVTISIGATTYNINNPNFSLHELIKTADKALYASKQNGRNTYTIIEE